MSDCSSICRVRLSTSLPRLVTVYFLSCLLSWMSSWRTSFLRWYANLPDSFLDLNPASDFRAL